MRLIEKPTVSVGTTHTTTQAKEVILEDEELYDLFVDEVLRQRIEVDNEEEFVALLKEVQDGAKARGASVDMSALVQIAVEKVKHREVPTKDNSTQSTKPAMTVVESRNAHENGYESKIVAEKILRKLGWNPDELSDRRRLKKLLETMNEAGVQEPHTWLTIRDAVQKAGVAERTLRRYIADGLLETERQKGPHGMEHRLYAPALFALLQQRTGAFERSRSSPIEEVSREVASLCRIIVEQQAAAERRTDRLLDEIRQQSRVIDELRAEQRDARAQMHLLQEQMIRALMPPKKRSFWEVLLNRSVY